MRRVLAWLAIALVLLGILVPVAALAFSVRVQGNSMSPTLDEGDRLLVDVLGRGDVRRFDLVDAAFQPSGARVVKRVIGLPGDRVSVGPPRGEEPQVFVRPSGDERVYRVVNEAWVGQVGGATRACCNQEGSISEKRTWATVPEDHYWVLGDNWGGSEDSRDFGFVRAQDVAGRLNLRIRPLADFGRVPNPAELQPVG